jgi:hypothetical protein
MRTDQAHAGIDRWVGESLLVDVNAYARKLANVATRPLPTADTTPRPLFESGSISSYGVEVGVRKLSGRLTGGVAYSYGKSTQRIGATTFAAPGDRRHTLDATSMIRLGVLRLGAGMTYMTGAPYTRMYGGLGRLGAPDSVLWQTLPDAEAPGAQRFPSYFSLDLFSEMTVRVRGVGVTPYFGVQNATNRRNFSTFLGRSATGSTAPWDFPIQSNGDLLYWSGTLAANVGLRLVF